jgi:hypothetical protein
LTEFKNRNAQFEIVFWKGTRFQFVLVTPTDPFIVYTVNRHATLQTGGCKLVVASRTLAKHLLFRQLIRLDIPVHVFQDLDDPSWLKYEAAKKVS